MSSVIIVQHHSPFANDEEEQDEQPRHYARDGSENEDGGLIDACLALAEMEVKYWKAKKAGDERTAEKASAEGQRLAKRVAALRGDDDGE
jgi:hypothetical protein